MAREGERTFLVERYVPRLDRQTAAAISSRFHGALQALHEEGVTLRWLRSFALIGEETYLCIVAALDQADVVELSRRAGFEHDHVVEMVALDGRREIPLDAPGGSVGLDPPPTRPDLA